MNRREFLIFSGAALMGLALSVDHRLSHPFITSLGAHEDSLSKNVILIVLDTVRAQNLSLHGYQRQTTPYLEKLAVKSIVFEKAFSTAPWTLQSHASMFTGKYPHELSASWLTPLDHTFPVVSEILAASGYMTAGFSANNIYCTAESGLARGFSYFEDHPISIKEMLLSAEFTDRVVNHYRLRQVIDFRDVLERKNAASVNQSLLRWLSKRDHKPFFAFLNYYDAHEPVLPLSPYDTQFGTNENRRVDLLRFLNHEGAMDNHEVLTELEIQAEIDAYDGTIAYMDNEIGKLLEQLSQLGILDDSIVVITSDHGEQFGEHGLFSHGNSLYLPSIHVPLMLYVPGFTETEIRIGSPVSLINLPATIWDLIGSGKQPIPGQSMLTYLHNRNTNAAVFAELQNGDPEKSPAEWQNAKRTIVDQEMQYIENGDGSVELYRYSTDPQETMNLAIDEQYSAEVKHYSKLMKAYL
jgi:arylsulfatase A-like enzyme